MDTNLELVTRATPLGLILLGLASALAAALTPLSIKKGRLRLCASLFVSAGFTAGSVVQMLKEEKLWPGALGLAAGIFLAWVDGESMTEIRRERLRPHQCSKCQPDVREVGK